MTQILFFITRTETQLVMKRALIYSKLHNEISHRTKFPAEFRPTAQTQQPTVCQLAMYGTLWFLARLPGS